MLRLVALSFAACLAALPVRAHEGHDHGPQASAAPASVAPRGEAHSDKFELVAVAGDRTLVIYIDEFSTNAPAKEATVEVETPDGPVKAEAQGEGVYRLTAPFLARGGHIDLIVSVTARGETDILPVSLDIADTAIAAQARETAKGKSAGHWLRSIAQSPVATGTLGFAIGALLVIAVRCRRRAAALAILLALAGIGTDRAMAHEGHDHAEPAPQATTQERAMRLPDGAVFVPKPIQRIFGLRTVVTRDGAFQRSVELPGRVIPDPNASGYVQTALGGLLSPPPGGFPRLGAQVKQGDVLAYVTPPLQAIDVSDMRQRQGELDQQIAIVQRRLARQESLVGSGAVARAQVEETRLELEGLRDRRLGLETVRREPVPLIAPVSGVIADGTPINGQIAQSNAIVFHIVTPDRLWVEALSFDAIAGTGAASAKAANGQTMQLAFRGSGLADRSQSIPVHFSIEGGAKGLRSGQFVTVFTETGEERKGIAVPRNAVVRAANGQDFVFEHTGAERFEPRPVRVETLDADRVLIAAGIEPGKRVVVQGAELLDHVR